MTETFTSTPPSSAASARELEEELEEDDEELDEELLLGIEGDEGWLEDEELGIDGDEGDEDDEELGIEGAELGDEEDELGIEGMELLELLELEVVSQPASSRARAETVNSVLREECVTGVLMLLLLLIGTHIPACFRIIPVQVAESYATSRDLASQGPVEDRAGYRLTSGGRGQHPQENIGFSRIFRRRRLVISTQNALLHSARLTHPASHC